MEFKTNDPEMITPRLRRLILATWEKQDLDYDNIKTN